MTITGTQWSLALSAYIDSLQEGAERLVDMGAHAQTDYWQDVTMGFLWELHEKTYEARRVRRSARPALSKVATLWSESASPHTGPRATARTAEQRHGGLKTAILGGNRRDNVGILFSAAWYEDYSEYGNKVFSINQKAFPDSQKSISWLSFESKGFFE